MQRTLKENIQKKFREQGDRIDKNPDCQQKNAEENRKKTKYDLYLEACAKEKSS